MRARTVFLVLIALVVLVAASALSMYPSLSDARDVVDEQWATLEPALASRYESLGGLSRAVRAEQGDLELLDDVDDALAKWEGVAARRDADTKLGAEAANRCESASALLARTVTSKPSLRDNQDVVVALGAFLGTDPRGAAQTFNDAVKKYDRARNRFPGPLFASTLGFDSLTTIEVPPALDQLELPEAPLATPPTPSTQPAEPAEPTTKTAA